MSAIAWGSVALRDVASFSGGTTPPRARQADYFDGGTVPWVKTLDLTNSVVSVTDERVTERAVSDTGLSIQPTGTVLVAMYGGYNQIGRTGLLVQPATVNQAITAVRPDRRRLDPEFLLHVLNHNVGYWRSVASSSRKDPNITKEDVRSFRLPLPPLEEQRWIANAISDANVLLESLEQNITKKRALKQGMMQHLLTGRTRLPGFTSPWINTTWGELIERCTSGATPLRSRPEFWGGPIPWVTSTELTYGTILRVPQSITREGFVAANLTLWSAGTFVMAITGLEAAGTRGSCGLLGRHAATNQSCMAIVPNAKLTAEFLYHFYTLRGEELAFRYCQGTKQQSFTAGIVRTLPIYVPTDKGEQDAIAHALRAADEEIATLQRRWSKTLAIKTGMAQQLLTGRTLLPVPGAAA